MRTDVLGVGFDSIDIEEAVDRALVMIGDRSGGYVVTPNPEIVMLCRENSAFDNAVKGAELVLADGIGVIYGAKILNRPLKSKLPGIDFAQALMEKMAERNMSVYLFGAKPNVAQKAGENLAKMFPGLVIAGSDDGYFTDDTSIIENIRNAKPDLLLVCLGAPKQELWMQKNAGKLNTGLMAGLGGSLDVFAGEVKRAPVAFQKMGMEWFYRLLKEPKRIKRMIKLPLFLVAVVGQKMKGQ